MSLDTNLQTLATRVATEAKALRTLVNGNTGDLTGLTTTAKNNLVAAINELDAAIGSGGVDPASETVAGVVELATTAEADTGTDTVRAVTPAGLAQGVASRIAALVDTAPGTLDTLNELAAALGDDPNFATTINTALANRVRHDTAAQGLTAPQQANARANIDAASATDVGSTNTDYVATFEAGLV